MFIISYLCIIPTQLGGFMWGWLLLLGGNQLLQSHISRTNIEIERFNMEVARENARHSQSYLESFCYYALGTLECSESEILDRWNKRHGTHAYIHKMGNLQEEVKLMFYHFNKLNGY